MKNTEVSNEAECISKENSDADKKDEQIIQV